MFGLGSGLQIKLIGQAQMASGINTPGPELGRAELTSTTAVADPPTPCCPYVCVCLLELRLNNTEGQPE